MLLSLQNILGEDLSTAEEKGYNTTNDCQELEQTLGFSIELYLGIASTNEEVDVLCFTPIRFSSFLQYCIILVCLAHLINLCCVVAVAKYVKR